MDNDFYNDDFEEIGNGGSSLDANQTIYNEPPKNVKPKKTLGEKAQSVKQTVQKTVDTAGKAVNATGKTVSAAGKTLKTTGKAVEVAGKAAQLAGKGMQATGKAAKAAGKGINAASDGLLKAGEAASATGVGAIAGVPLAALGVLGKVAGYGTQAAGTGLDVGGKGVETAGKGMEKAGQGMQKAGKATDKAGKKVSDTGKKISNKVGANKNKINSRIRGAANKKSLKMESTGATDDAVQKVGKFGKKIGKNILKDIAAFFMPVGGGLRKIKVMLIGAAMIPIFLIILLIAIFSPVLEIMEKLGEFYESAKLQVQLNNNLYSGFGGQDTKEAFLEEAKYLYEYYDESLDMSLIMSTIFFTERDGFGTTDYETGSDKDDDGISFGSILSFLKDEYKSLFEKTDEDGKKYTTGKIYRLRKLAQNQMDTSTPTATEEVPLDQFLERYKNRMSENLDQLFESIQGIFPKPEELVNPSAMVGKVLAAIITKLGRIIYDIICLIDGTETWDTVSIFQPSEAVVAIQKFMQDYFIMMGDVGSVHVTATGVMVTMHKYAINLDHFEKYLHDEYIPNMPEFKKQLGDLEGSKREQRINDIIRLIYENADEFDGIFGYSAKDAADEFNEECVGNVNPNLVDAIKKLPVGGSSFAFDGTNAYGLSPNGTQNNGLNLTETTAGVKAGDPVYSIYSGKVTEVEKKQDCNVADDTECEPRGNYVRIKHDTIRAGDGSFDIETFYSNLGTVSVKKGDKVKAGDKIGTAGQTGDATEPMVHFEMFDTKEKKNLNPTNLFIPCVNSINGMCGSNVQENVWSYFRSKGFSTAATAGIMGNIQQESSFIPDNIQGGGKGPAAGLFQLENINTGTGRWKNLDNYAKKNNSTWKDTVTQLNYMYEKDMAEQFRLYTGKTPYRYSTGALAWWPTKVTVDDYKNLSDIDQATEIFERVFERASKPMMENRIRYAKKFYKDYKSFQCEGGNAVAPGGKSNNAKVEQYLSEMMKIANNDKVGYDQATRNLNPNVDCSSFVFYSLLNANVIKGSRNEPFRTATMGPILVKYGFQQIKYNRSILQRGDIIVQPGSHTTTYLGEGKQIAAHTNYDGRNGDSTGREVNVNDYSEGTHHYQYIYRLK